VVVARTAEFYPAGTRKAFTAMGPRKAKPAPDYQEVKQDSLLDADGRFVSPRTKVRYSDAGGPCGWHRVPADEALQERVERVGMRLVPEYQKQLAQDAPSRIPFRFYAVAEEKVRSVLACNTGLVLVPKNVVERLENDDQLAAVLADGVAFNLVRQQTTAADRLEISTEVAAAFVGGWAAVPAAEALIGRERMLRLERECARIALQVMAEAGYDPWQAPEAWRRLGSREMPKDLQSVEYTREGRYQLSILNVQYKKASAASAAGGDAQR
jgi:predicted Zn-dependent protease